MSAPIAPPSVPTPASTRAHLYRPIVNEAGDVYQHVTVQVLVASTARPYPGTIFRTETGADTWANPFIAAPGVVDVYLDQPTQVILALTLQDSAQVIYTQPIDVLADAAMMVTSVTPILILADMPSGAMLSVTDAGSPYWRTIKIDHEHAADGDRTLFLGNPAGFSPQDVTFPRATVLGWGSGTDAPRSGLSDTTALGSDAAASGARSTAVGARAVASERPAWPWTADSVALGGQSWARNGSVAAGLGADATAEDAIALGRMSFSGSGGLGLGCFAYADTDSISIGYRTGDDARGVPGSIGLGAEVQYGLPSTNDPGDTAIVLGSHDPRANVIFPWANPQGSQSESPLAEYKPEMEFSAPTIQFSRQLSTVLSGILTSPGDASFGRVASRLSFYGATPTVQAGVGEDEPCSGIEALDSLIYALRDLGLLKSRHEALVHYVASDMLPYYQDGDDATRWNEHGGTDVARSTTKPGRAPTFVEASEAFNGRPVIAFTNGELGRYTCPREVMLGGNLITQAYHVLVVADHATSRLGTREGLLNLRQSGEHDPNTSVMLQAWRAGTRYWDPEKLPRGTHYTRDWCDQSFNFDACPPAPHVYRLSRPGGWPTASMVIGGPADAVASSAADYWRGSVSTVSVLDSTWDSRAIQSMECGLMFRHDIGQDHRCLRDPAIAFILKQHDPLSGVRIKLDRDYPDSFTGTVAGSVTGITAPLVDVPWVNIWSWFECYEYCGPLVGYWANLPISPGKRFPDMRRYQVLITTARKNNVIDIADSEFLFGFCWLEDVGIWCTGCDWVPRGFKTAYLMDRKTNQVLAVSGNPSQKFADIEVRVYVSKNGTLTLQGTSPLWCDRRFSVVSPNTGHKVVRVYRISTGEVLASTEWQERALPRYTVASQDDPDYTQGVEREARTYDSAVAAMALCEAGPDFYRRARNILSTLVSVMNDDGSINDSYDSLFPTKGPGKYSARSVTWFGLAMLYYQSATGDSRFIPTVDRVARWLFNQQNNGLIPASGTDSSYRTDDNVSAYYFFRRFSEVIAESSS